MVNLGNGIMQSRDELTTSAFVLTASYHCLAKLASDMQVVSISKMFMLALGPLSSGTGSGSGTSSPRITCSSMTRPLEIISFCDVKRKWQVVQSSRKSRIKIQSKRLVS